MNRAIHHNNQSFSLTIVLCFINIVAAVGIILSSSIVRAESNTLNASVTVPEACTLTSTTNTPHTATLSPNTYSGANSDYQNGIGKTTLTAMCNDYNGFAIYAIGYTGNSYDDTNHTKLVGSSTGSAISTKVYASGDTTSNWSMKVTKVTDSSVSYNPTNMSIQNSFDSWHTVPDTYTKVAQYHASTGSSVTDSTLGAKVETTYAAYIAANQSADTYVGQVKYTMVHPYNEEPLQPQQPTAGCINYFANASTAVGTMGCQSKDDSGNDLSDGASVTLLASNFSRTGYGFAGWSDSFDYATNPSAHFYGPSETITVPNGATANGLSLYAIWIESEGSIQDQSKVASVCNSLTTAPTDGTANLTSVSALTDQRDNNTYAIAKLADGKCWMIENLRLDNTADHNSDGTLAQGYGTSITYGNFSGLADAEFANFYTYTGAPTIANSLYYSGTQSGTASINIGDTDHSDYRIPRYNNYNHQIASANRPQNPTTNDAVNTTTHAGMYSYGNYYNWHAAMANTIYYDSPTATDTSGKTSETVNTSLCPSGWKLPRGGDKSKEVTNDFWTLIVTGLNGGINPANYSSSTTPYYTGATETANVSNALRSFPNNFLYSGCMYDDLSDDWRGVSGIYLTSTAASYYQAYKMLLSKTRVQMRVLPGTNAHFKYQGDAVRCLLGSS